MPIIVLYIIVHDHEEGTTQNLTDTRESYT